MAVSSTELVTINTNQFFTAHRNLQIWKKGLPLTQASFLGTYDRYGRGVDMTFNSTDLARGGAFVDYVNQYIPGIAGTGLRKYGPFKIPAERAGDRIGSLIPAAWSTEVMADPDYNLVNNNCVTTLAEQLNKIRLRFIRLGLPRTSVRIFRPLIILQKSWLFPVPGGIPPINVRPDVQVLKDVINDPGIPAPERAERQAQALDAFGSETFTIFYSPFTLDREINAALAVWNAFPIPEGPGPVA